ncbi:MAG: twin-arginine translocation signal domain-containing protein, partial [Chloroflexota bacterium]
MRTSRRTFLKAAAIAAGAAMLPHVPLKVAAQSSGNTLAEYLTAMETPFAAPLNIYIQRVIRSGNISLLMYDV